MARPNGSIKQSFKNERNKEKTDEKLRGKVRELQKEIQRQQRVITSLQNELLGKSSKRDKEEVLDNKEPVDSPSEFICPECHHTDMDVKKSWHPVKNADILFITCKRCQNVRKLVAGVEKV